MLDPTSIADPKQITKEDIQHLVVRRFKNDVLPQTPGFQEVHDVFVSCPSTPEEDELLIRLGKLLVHTIGTGRPKRDAFFSVTLLNSAVAFGKALDHRITSLERRVAEYSEIGEVYADSTRLLLPKRDIYML